ncbi:hypothetical protein [Arachidicoccus terrestris]|uniref:hypothetical protein n=1 Tax=Arachidicoccus terrestris TaxID=2875539 RepID=UPI001CC41652|nr:hypothetical protein [Arachidicoccus terrestris]UAY56924.1 hypothetical protein K9M52_08035 [Arachidicoccus terrestris]
MYTLILLFCCTGFFCLYNTSRKARLFRQGQLEIWLQSHQASARLLGLGCITGTFLALIYTNGAVMGVLHFLLMVMAAACYIVALAPFGLIRRNHILALGAAAFFLELLIF